MHGIDAYMHVCMHTCMHVCMYACVHVCMYACVHVCMHACMHVCMYACMHVYMYACMHVCIYACMHICMYACMHVCMYACMHACMHVCMYNSDTDEKNDNNNDSHLVHSRHNVRHRVFSIVPVQKRSERPYSDSNLAFSFNRSLQNCSTNNTQCPQ